jgi:serine/threonine protein kinase
MAPEQAIRGNVSVESDIYSFGCVLYEMVCGHSPFTFPDPESVIAAHLRKVPEQANSLRKEVPLELSVAISRCLEKDPNARFHSFAELRKVLLRVYSSVEAREWEPKAADRDTDSLYLRIERCIGLSKAGKQEIALKEIDRILAECPKDCFARFTKSNILKEMSRYPDAIEILRGLSKEDEVEPSVWYNLGILLAVTGGNEEGTDCLTKAAQSGHEGAQKVLKVFREGSKEGSVIIID